MIELQNIFKSYQYQGQPIDVLKNINLDISKGECICIRAPSGKGKTTLLNIIGAMLTPTSGTLVINGQNITELPHHFRSSFRRDNIGFIFQQFNLLPRFTVMENLLFPLVPGEAGLKAAAPKIDVILKRLQIDHRRQFTANLLSGGEQQRVAIARALVNDPRIVIADEPFTNLDPVNRQFIVDLLSEVKSEKKTIIISSTTDHDNLSNDLVDRDIFL